ncbi:BQ2448_8104 [Microbotryum intermedium]|uniref:BQ2448_8104 protein n=1 Tax=Microbotryum intermedium TaxID=269621 RepID=A0A238FMS1_9BASI|nr:BQ2448_8104 [Microbotryum intermedium]
MVNTARELSSVSPSSSSGVAPAEYGSTASKRRKTIHMPTQRQSRKGKLRAFQSMPIDILIEIVGLADPATLVSLAQVSRVFASLLLSERYRFIWIAAMDRAGFPALEAQANRANSRPITYMARIVFDHHCRSVPTWCSRREHFYSLDELLLVNATLRRLQFAAPSRSVLDRECSESVDLYSKYLKDRAPYVLAVARDVAKLISFEAQLKACQKACNKERQNEKKQIRVARIEEIKKRCLELGIDPEHFPSQHPFVKVAVPFSDATWMRSKDLVLQAAEEAKQTRLRNARHEDWRGRLDCLLGIEMGAEALTLPDVEQVLQNPQIKSLWYDPCDFIFDDATFESHKDTFVAVVNRFSAAQRLTFFCIVAEALELIGLGLDQSVLERAGPPPLTAEQDRLVDEVLADPLNQFYCCGELRTYDELVVHWAVADVHDRSGQATSSGRKSVEGQHAAILVSFDVLRCLRNIADTTGIRRPTFAAVNDLGPKFRCYSCRAWKPAGEMWAYMTAHHVKKHCDRWFCENPWEVTVERPAVSPEDIASRKNYAHIDFSPKGFKRRQ